MSIIRVRSAGNAKVCSIFPNSMDKRLIAEVRNMIWCRKKLSAFSNGAGAGPAKIRSFQSLKPASSALRKCSAKSFTLSSLRPFNVNKATRATGGYRNCSRNSTSCS